MTEQKQVITYPSDVEALMRMAMDLRRLKDGTVSRREKDDIFTTFHKVYAPVAKNYLEIPFVKSVLEELRKSW
jgi:hypothetical protein